MCEEISHVGTINYDLGFTIIGTCRARMMLEIIRASMGCVHAGLAGL